MKLSVDQLRKIIREEVESVGRPTLKAERERVDGLRKQWAADFQAKSGTTPGAVVEALEALQKSLAAQKINFDMGGTSGNEAAKVRAAIQVINEYLNEGTEEYEEFLATVVV